MKLGVWSCVIPILTLGMTLPFAARAQSNFNPYPIGARESGMGGAAVALADDAAGPYYNPAGAAFAPKDVIAVSTGLYGFVGGSYQNVLGQSLSYSFSNLNLIPSAANTLLHLGKRDGERPSPWVLVLNILTPYSYEVDQRATARAGMTTAFVATTDTTILVGPSIAWRAAPTWSFGLALYGMFHTLLQRADVTVLGPGSITQVTVNEDARNLGLLAALGAQYRPNSNWSFGLAVRSPSWTFSGSGSVFTRALRSMTGGTLQVQVTSDSVVTQRVYPTQIVLGMAYAGGSTLTLAADVQLYLPHAYDAITDAANPQRNVRVENGFTGNVAVGLEYRISSSLQLRAGFFTDLPANPAPRIEGNTTIGDTQRYLFGGTLALAWSTENSSTQIGAIASGGPVTVPGLDLQNSTFAPIVSSGYEWRAFGTVSSSYRF